MNADRLRTSPERTLFVTAAIFSALCWLILLITIVGAVYGVLIGAFVFFAHAVFIAHIRGNGVKITGDQFPELHAKIALASERLGLVTPTEAYVIQSGGMLNAFATRFLSRNFIVLYADLLEACGDDGHETDMIIGHEVGHLALKHLKRMIFLLPARVAPWLGSAYSRACESSCDLCGMEVAGDLEGSIRGLAILATGGKYARRLDVDAYMKQVGETNGFWMSVCELNASHPFLSKRIASLINHRNPGTIPVPGRHPLAYPVAPFLGVGPASGGSGGLVMVMILGILAAIAIPNYMQFKEKAEKAAAARHELRLPPIPASTSP
ncbi:MAG TPA: M48 family metallopeptidase [Candidatus Deferrimicrobiaceae bacterium]|jgi:Zn-dependent protease with chaperone function